MEEIGASEFLIAKRAARKMIEFLRVRQRNKLETAAKKKAEAKYILDKEKALEPIPEISQQSSALKPPPTPGPKRTSPRLETSRGSSYHPHIKSDDDSDQSVKSNPDLRRYKQLKRRSAFGEIQFNPASEYILSEED